MTTIEIHGPKSAPIKCRVVQNMSPDLKPDTIFLVEPIRRLEVQSDQFFSSQWVLKVTSFGEQWLHEQLFTNPKVCNHIVPILVGYNEAIFKNGKTTQRKQVKVTLYMPIGSLKRTLTGRTLRSIPIAPEIMDPVIIKIEKELTKLQAKTLSWQKKHGFLLDATDPDWQSRKNNILYSADSFWFHDFDKSIKI